MGLKQVLGFRMGVRHWFGDGLDGRVRGEKIFMASPPFLLSFSMFLILDFECSSVIALFFNLPLLIQFSFCGSPLYFV